MKNSILRARLARRRPRSVLSRRSEVILPQGARRRPPAHQRKRKACNIARYGRGLKKGRGSGKLSAGGPVRHDEVGVPVAVGISVAKCQLASRLRGEQLLQVVRVLAVGSAERRGSVERAVGVLRVAGRLGEAWRDSSGIGRPSSPYDPPANRGSSRSDRSRGGGVAAFVIAATFPLAVRCASRARVGLQVRVVQVEAHVTEHLHRRFRLARLAEAQLGVGEERVRASAGSSRRRCRSG